MNTNIPKTILDIIKDLDIKIDNIGRSEDKVMLIENKYVLKVSKNINHLKREYEISKLIEDKIKGSKCLCFVIENNIGYYLRTYINGYSLIDDKYTNNPNLLIEALIKTVKVLRSLDKYDFSKYLSNESTGNSFIHGDLCLPNIYFDENNEFIGFIDLGDAGKGDPWVDYSWMLWSLTYNLKTDRYNSYLLNKLNIKFDEEKYNKYIPLECKEKIKEYKEVKI